MPGSLFPSPSCVLTLSPWPRFVRESDMSAWPESGRPRSAAQVPIKNDSLSPNKNNEKQCHDRLDIDEIAAVTICMRRLLALHLKWKKGGWWVSGLSLLTLKGHGPSTFHSEHTHTHSQFTRLVGLWPYLLFTHAKTTCLPRKLPLSKKHIRAQHYRSGEDVSVMYI